jgi:hypothetical protein
MPLIRSRLPSSFKIMTVPIGAWMLIGLTYLWPVDSADTEIALTMMRGAALIVAIFGTLYLPIAFLILRFLKVSDAK